MEQQGHTHQQSGSVKWQAGLCLAASAWTLHRFDRPNLYFRALSTPGDLAPAMDGISWSFHLGLENRELHSGNRIWTNGYEFHFSESENSRSVVAFFIEPGILVGKTDGEIRPSLFSPELSVQEDVDSQWLEMADGGVVLLTTRTPDGEHRFCLAVSEEDHSSALHRARKHLATDLEAVQSTEQQKRASFWNALPPSCEHPGLLNFALESMILHLQPPTGAIPFRWSIGDLYSAPRFDLNQLLPLVTAWQRVDPVIARELVKSAFCAQNVDGGFNRFVYPNGQPQETTPCWPLLAQSLETVCAGSEDPELLDFAIPRLKRYLQWAVAHYRISKDEMVCWPSELESFIPDVFDQNLASADLAAFLIGEFDAFCRLCNKAPTHTADGDDLMSFSKDLITGLTGFLWSKTTGNFRSRYLGGEFIERITLSSVLPLIWSELPPMLREELLRQLVSTRHFRSGFGAPLWMAWESDPTPPPVESRHQNMVLISLLRSSAHEELQLLSSDWLQALAAQFRSTGGLYNDLRSTASKPEDSASIRSMDIHACILAILASGSKEQPHALGAPTSPFLKKLENHRLSVLAGVVGVLLVILSSIIVFYIQKKTMNINHLQTLAGLAKQYCIEGNYEQAIRVYRQLQVGSGNAATVDIMLANALFNNGDWKEAELLYRQADEKSEKKDPTVHFNLALALFRQGRFKESRKEYASIIEKYEATYPEITLRAKTAMELIEECTPVEIH